MLIIFLYCVHLLVFNRIQTKIVEPYNKIVSRTAQLRKLQVLELKWYCTNFDIKQYILDLIIILLHFKLVTKCLTSIWNKILIFHVFLLTQF